MVVVGLPHLPLSVYMYITDRNATSNPFTQTKVLRFSRLSRFSFNRIRKMIAVRKFDHHSIYSTRPRLGNKSIFSTKIDKMVKNYNT